ncbi:MAG: AtpZ/AtpI family protein [Deltaproteobacteria bacterium]|nr:AtpZ/AtpI family protein [Deltaproteobacteria bacterium]
MNHQPKEAPSPDPSPQQSALYTYAKFSGFGLQLGASFLLGIYGGKYLDGQLDTRPLFLVIGALLGMAAGFYSVYKLIVQTNKRKKQ